MGGAERGRQRGLEARDDKGAAELDTRQKRKELKVLARLVLDA